MAVSIFDGFFFSSIVFFYYLLARASSSCLFQFVFIVSIAFVCGHELEARASREWARIANPRYRVDFYLFFIFFNQLS